MTAPMSERARTSSRDFPAPESSEYMSTLEESTSSVWADFNDRDQTAFKVKF